jgi:hypothetical protein
MDIKDYLKSIYIYEQNLLKTICNKLIESKQEEVHDYLLSIFDEVDELNRTIYKFLIENKYLEKERIIKSEKEKLYEKLDSFYVEINS